MKVILNEDVKGTGKKGQVVNVSDGFGKNFLIKNKKASLATNTALNDHKQKSVSNQFHEEEKRQTAQAECDKINGKTITIKVKAGESGKIFGSVTSKEIAETLKEHKVTIDKKKITLDNPIKNTGTYEVALKFYKGIIAKVFVEVL
jgi:large subunit ribosomal protein L9